jgi:hypothetical protein
MTPWTRVDKELSILKRDWKWLASELEIKIQTVNHWQTRGIPAKYHPTIEVLLKKPARWITGDVDQFVAPSGYTAAGLELAALLDMIPESDRLRRAQAFSAAVAAMTPLLPPADATRSATADPGKPPL